MENKTAPENNEKTHLKDKQNLNRSPRPRAYSLLWVLVIILLAFNLVLAWSLLSARRQVDAYRQTFDSRLVQAGTIVENIKGASIDYVAHIDQTIPISVQVPLDYKIAVPVNMVVPINTTVSIPLLGGAGPSIDVPISMNVPVNTTITVPIKMTIPVDASMPITMDVPVSIKVSDTFLADNLDQAGNLLAQLNLDLGGFLGGFLKIP
jgi:hypothetical protein